MKWWLPALLLLFSTTPVFAGVVINEFLANPSSGNNEWVELYNTGSEIVDLNSYSLEDKSGSKKPISSLGIISPNSFAVYEYPSGDGWLNNTNGDTVILKNNDSIVDEYLYTNDQKENVSLGRLPNGTGGFTEFTSYTKGTVNPDPSPIPTPTPTPTLTPTPTPTLKPSSTPTPKSLLTPTPTQKPSSTPLTSPSPIGSTLPAGELGVLAVVSDASMYPTPTGLSSPTPGILSTATSGSNWLAVVVTAIGGAVFAVAGYLLIRRAGTMEK